MIQSRKMSHRYRVSNIRKIVVCSWTTRSIGPFNSQQNKQHVTLRGMWSDLITAIMLGRTIRFLRHRCLVA